MIVWDRRWVPLSSRAWYAEISIDGRKFWLRTDPDDWDGMTFWQVTDDHVSVDGLTNTVRAARAQAVSAALLLSREIFPGNAEVFA